jgi:hypothetical protein
MYIHNASALCTVQPGTISVRYYTPGLRLQVVTHGSPGEHESGPPKAVLLSSSTFKRDLAIKYYYYFSSLPTPINGARTIFYFSLSNFFRNSASLTNYSLTDLINVYHWNSFCEPVVRNYSILEKS